MSVSPRVAPGKPRIEWRVLPPAPPSEVATLVRELKIPPLLASIVWGRGLALDAGRLLGMQLEPAGIARLEQAAERLEVAVRRREPILLHGDYDADGVSGTAVLLLGLRSLGARVEAFIPDRLGDGYGIHPDRVDEHARRCRLFVTIDCGITNLAELARLQAAGVDTLVTDHHHPGEELPTGLVVHPAVGGGSTSSNLTGAGVAFHLLWALHRRMGLEAPLEFADLATLGTVADVAPILAENRALVKAGLARMAGSSWPGIRALVSLSGLKGPVTARDVAFVLAPRINAAGRMGHAGLALELLTTQSDRRARELASRLDQLNDERRRIQEEMFESALKRADPESPALVLDDDAWHPGIMGIVASKLLERFYRPVFIIAQGKGSVRSTPGISAVKGLRFAAQHLRRFGGHAQAAGFAIQPESIPLFRQSIFRFMEDQAPPVPSLLSDAVVHLDEVDSELLRALDDLEPFGEGNQAPLFTLSDRLEMARAVGRDGATLQLRVAGMRGVAWRKGELAAQLRAGEPVNAAITVREREWQGRTELEFVAEEVREVEPLSLATISAPGVSALPVYRGAPHETVEQGGSPAAWLRELPLGEDPLRASEPLQQLLAAGGPVWFDLTTQELTRIRAMAASLPSLDDVRKAFVFRQRGVPTPFAPAKARIADKVLVELGLVDGMGRLKRGEKRDPYSSRTMMAALLERYRLNSFVNAYRTFDDEGFALAVSLLFGDGGHPA